MAKKTNKNSNSDSDPAEVDTANPSEEIIEDAVETVEEAQQASDEAIEDAQSMGETMAEGSVEDAEILDEAEDALEEADAEGLEIPTADEPPAPAPQPEQVVVRKGGFVPVVLGGLVAGGIGYGVASYQGNGVDLQAVIDGQAAEITALKEQVASLPPEQDLTGLEASVENAQTALDDTNSALSDLGTQVADAIARIDALERQPNADGTLTDTALAAFESDLQALRDELGQQQAEMQAMANTAAEQLEATRNEAVAIEENAVATARKATARTVLAQIQGAADTGAPIGALLSDLSGALDDAVPAALNDVADGVPTLAALQASFPDVARSALSVARREGVSGEAGSGFTSFLRNQFDVRSTAATEGDTADAILSRAEASLRTGMLNDTLAELSALPEVVRASMSDWTAQAELRAAALDAIAQLSDTLNIN